MFDINILFSWPALTLFCKSRQYYFNGCFFSLYANEHRNIFKPYFMLTSTNVVWLYTARVSRISSSISYFSLYIVDAPAIFSWRFDFPQQCCLSVHLIDCQISTRRKHVCVFICLAGLIAHHRVKAILDFNRRWKASFHSQDAFFWCSPPTVCSAWTVPYPRGNCTRVAHLQSRAKF